MTTRHASLWRREQRALFDRVLTRERVTDIAPRKASSPKRGRRLPLGTPLRIAVLSGVAASRGSQWGTLSAGFGVPMHAVHRCALWLVNAGYLTRARTEGRPLATAAVGITPQGAEILKYWLHGAEP